MGAHCAPLRKKKSSAVLFFEAVAGLWSAPDYLRKGVIHKRVETLVSTLLCPCRVGKSPLRFSEKTPRPLGTNTLTQFVHPAGSVQIKQKIAALRRFSEKASA